MSGGRHRLPSAEPHSVPPWPIDIPRQRQPRHAAVSGPSVARMGMPSESTLTRMRAAVAADGDAARPGWQSRPAAPSVIAGGAS